MVVIKRSMKYGAVTKGGYKMLTLTRLHGLLGPLNCMVEGSRLIRRANGISECRKKIINTVEADVVRCCRAENRCCK